MEKIYRIHPAIGIARLGNSPNDYFIGSEAPGVLPSLTKADEAPNPTAKHKDAQRRIKRQGARFRVYEFTYDHNELKNVREITAAEAQIEPKIAIKTAGVSKPVKRAKAAQKKRMLMAQTSTRIIRMFTPPEELEQEMTSKGKPKKVGKSKRRKRGL